MPNIANNREYKWTTTEGSLLDEVPRIYAKSYTITDNEALNTVKSWLNSINLFSTYKDFYNNLHRWTGDPEQWVFPYFDDNVRGFSNEWGSNMVNSTTGGSFFFSDLLQGAKALGEKGQTTAGILQQGLDKLTGGNATGSLFEPPKFYQYGVSDGPVTVEFSLINTENEADFSKNYMLINRLITENRFNRQTGLLTQVPALWSVTIPGYRAIRWASCDVSVSLLGRRSMKARGAIIAPEGYKVALTFKPLYTEPRNFMGDALIGDAL